MFSARARSDVDRTAALLGASGYMGTLAATRCLGRRGVPVVVASSGVLSPARWSRAAARVVTCKTTTPESAVEWLLAFGAAEPGAVLHPTSDETAWIIAKHASDFAPFFRLYAPSFDAIRVLLDKSRLHAAASAVGIHTPASFYPLDEGEVLRAAAYAEAFVVKPRSQVFYTSHMKGDVASGPTQVLRAWRACRASPHASSVIADAPDVDKPILQEFVPAAREGIYSISGFVDRSYEVLAARASRKVLQRPSVLGIGVCFEAAPVDSTLVEKLGALARRVGFFGVFEAEFVGDGAARRLIDFNPRYYGQMGFDVARGAPLPWMLHLGALGREDLLRREPTQHVADSPVAYEDLVTLQVMLFGRRAVGTLTPDARRRWRRWLAAHDGSAVDATIARDDPLPALASAASTLWTAARHPRGFWRSLHGDI